MDAYQHFRSGQPLAGLPNLNRTVFLKKGAFVCYDPDSVWRPIVEPNIPRVLIQMGKCAVVAADAKQVAVVVPQSADTYQEDDCYGIVEVEFRSNRASVANVYRVWVAVTGLRN